MSVKVAYYSPMRPSRSGIADYSALLLPALRERIEVVVAEPGRRAPAADVALYHLGNDPDAHGWIVDALGKRPGVIVLHEYVLHHLVAGVTIGRGHGRAYLDAMERELGVAGRLLGLGVLDNLLPLLWETQPERFPLSGVYLDQATGLIVHSHYVEQRARETGYGGRIWRIPHPAWPHGEIEPATDVDGEPLYGCFGFLNMNKRIPQLLEAFASLRRRRPGAKLLLVGAAGERFDVGRRLERLGLTEGVELLDYVAEERMWSLMAACDVLVNLRYPTMGETSGSVIRALSLGRPLVVSDVGWFSELPDDVVLKVAVDEYEVATLEAALALAADRGSALGASARRYVDHEHSLDHVADLYVAALETAAGGDAVNDAVLLRIAEAAVQVGIDDAGALARAAVDAGILT
ncbi:MAG TPA: glycosyltransferase family 4 protein [Gaiellaceae bacterium]|nr:glycosyltransferase family 4 protein [Gaiellaceae bacterium]